MTPKLKGNFKSGIFHFSLGMLISIQPYAPAYADNEDQNSPTQLTPQQIEGYVQKYPEGPLTPQQIEGYVKQYPNDPSVKATTSATVETAEPNESVKDENCQHSSDIDNAKLGCNSTQKFLKQSQATNAILQASGALVTNTAGQLGAMKAQTTGTQNSVYSAQASAMKIAGDQQLITGAATAIAGYMALKKADKHEQNAKALGQAHLRTADEVNQAGAQGDIRDKTANYLKGKEGGTKDFQTLQSTDATTGDQKVARERIQKRMNTKIDTAQTEQENMASDTKIKGWTDMLQGAATAAAGALSIAAGNQAAGLANNLSNTTGGNYQLTTTSPDTGTTGNANSTAINPGTATDPAVATTDGNINADGGVPSITPPVNPDTGSGGPGSGPVAGSFQGGKPPSAGGSSGNPSIGVGSMQAAKGDPEPGGPKMADNKSNTAYSPGGNSAYAGSNSVSAEKSADLGFLANLLPKPQEEMGKNNILEYGGRSPASAPYSFLGKDVNIFQRVSDRTTAKLKSGDVGG